MSNDSTANGAVLGAATTAGLLASFLNDWKYALLAALLILVLGFLIIFFKRRKKQQD